MLATPLAPRLPYQAGLNSLRALAALSVCCFHYFSGLLPERELVSFSKQLFERGYLGIDVFFVISGFIIPYSLLAKGYQLSDFGGYLRRRLVRINLPAYAAMLLVITQWVITDKLLNHNAHFLSGLTASRVLHNLFFTVPFSQQNWFVGACWTLATELQFYCFVGLFFGVVYKQARLTGFGLAFGLLAVVAALHLLPPATIFVYSPLFALGGTALHWQQRQLSTLAFGSCLVVFTALTYYLLDEYAAKTGLAAALALVLLHRPIPGLDWVGKVSYSLYLTHVLVGRTTEFVLFRLLAPTSDIGRTLVMGVCLAVALGVAGLFYRWVEQPCMRLAARQR